MHALLISLRELVPGDVCTSHRAEPTRKGTSLSMLFLPIPSTGSAPDCAFLAFGQRAMPMLQEAHSPVSHTHILQAVEGHPALIHKPWSHRTVLETLSLGSFA